MKQNDLSLAYEEISEKVRPYSRLYSYFDGHPALVYSTERLSRAFGKSFVYFAQNWGAVIINAVLDRLILKGFNSSDDRINLKMDAIFNKLNLNLDAQDVHESLQVTGEAFLIVDKVVDSYDIYFNDPRLCEVYYDPNRPKIKKYAAKRWLGEDGSYMNLYYTDRTEKYYSQSGNTAKSYQLIETIPNELGIIPVFHFRNSRRIIKGELGASEISELDAINKLFSDLMVAAEFEAFKVRVFISQVDPGDTKIGPDMKIWIPANETSGSQDSNVIELGGSSLQNFLEPINSIAQSLAIQTRTPKTYFMATGANLSGEALLVEEAPLVKKVQLKQEAYSPVWAEAMAYILELGGDKVEVSDITPVWAPVITEQPLTNAQIMVQEKQAGLPLASILRRQGISEGDINQIMEDSKTNVVIPEPVVL